MKKLACLTMLVIFTVILGACSNTSKTAGEMINPGDKIGDFLIMTGEGDVLFSFDLTRSCTKQGDKETYSCQSRVGDYVNITTGFYDDTVRSDTPTEQLDKDWSASRYELFVEDRPVNLEAFGYVETNHPILGVIRFWNVVVLTDQPGEITVRDAGIAGGKSFEGTTTYIFSAP